MKEGFSAEGVRRISYENGFIILLLSSIMNKKKISLPRRHIYWENVLKLAEYHNVVSPVYYAILGLEKEISREDADKFYMKYKKELLLGEQYRNAQEVIAWQMQKHKISGLLLAGVEDRNLYTQWEFGYTSCLEILTAERQLGMIDEIMTGMDYEKEENRQGKGVVYTRVPGIRVIFYDRISLGNRVLQKYLSEYTKRYLYVRQKPGYLSEPDISVQYLYRIGKLADAYMTGELKIRDVLDYAQFTKKTALPEEMKRALDVQEKSGLSEFARHLQTLADLWFGKGTDKDTSTAFMLEEYIFSMGLENYMLDKAIIPYEKTRLDFYQRNREKEWEKRQREWIFPPREYMMQCYPFLKRFPCFVRIGWGIRGIRFFRKNAVRFLKKQYFKGKDRIGKLKIKIIKTTTKEGKTKYEEHEDR